MLYDHGFLHKDTIFWPPSSRPDDHCFIYKGTIFWPPPAGLMIAASSTKTLYSDLTWSCFMITASSIKTLYSDLPQQAWWSLLPLQRHYILTSPSRPDDHCFLYKDTIFWPPPAGLMITASFTKTLYSDPLPHLLCHMTFTACCIYCVASLH